MGYEGLLTCHGIRATISTALNEVGYPKIWVDAQFTHADPILVPPVVDIQPKRLSAVPARPGPVVQSARLAGKSRDQINREIKAGRLLTLSMGNRGQRIPESQLDPLKHDLIRSLMIELGDKADSWRLHRALVQPQEQLEGRSPVDAVAADNVHEMFRMVDEVFGGQ